MNFSAALCIDDGVSKELISQANFLQIAVGCWIGLSRLGKLQRAIKTVRVTFENVGGKIRPVVQIFYEDTSHVEERHMIYFHSYPGITKEYSAELGSMIADRIAEDGSSLSLRHAITTYLERRREGYLTAIREIDNQLSTPAASVK